MNIKINIKTLIITFLSAIFCGLSINLYLKAGIGSDCITVFEDGLHHTLGISVGWASILYSCVFITLAYLFARRYLGLSSILFSILVGPAIDWLQPCMNLLPNSNYLFVQILLVLLAIFFIALSASLLILEENGMNPYDSVATALSLHFNLPYKLIRTMMDFLLFLIGWALGGRVGLGTIVASLLTSSMISFLVHRFQSFQKKIGA
ncbi:MULTISPECIES: YitT family protein [Terrabacteria group]|uniref:YczE/YyaS/YitT family protein n=1 Tax=Bacillati TaxID=1783272 RepID=UPI00193ACF9E|nr:MULTISPECIES: hypothetical protein [Terrabacteria group]MBW9212026.1 hypothetical protein [Trueperella sp. zg.1013]QRG87167.1 hypothetical protein JOS54_02340 [Bulleidia sp. zg-1006]